MRARLALALSRLTDLAVVLRVLASLRGRITLPPPRL
jgi:hypothetical protein